ncbi:MAG: hypothetical protein WAO76_12245 [Georgfuchsia sp.]
MRYSIAIALLVSCTAFNTHAADNSSNPCSLLDWQDFKSLGAVKDTLMSEAGWRQEKTPEEMPGSILFTNMCAAEIRSKAGRAGFTLSFDSFKGKVSEQQVGEWLKSTTATEAAQPDVATVKVGDMTTCETGQYDLPTKQEDDSVVTVVEHYIACDQQVGIQHVSLNVHVPEGNKGELPSPEQARDLLDKSVKRMKQNEFAPPDNKI